MSYSVEWIPIIDDRTHGDVLSAESIRELENPKGAYNYIDLNRIENNTKYCMEYMLDLKIIKVPPALSIKTNWEQTDIPTREDMARIVGNVLLLMDLSNPEIQDKFYTIYESTQFVYTLANAIEHNLDLMHTQNPLPIKKWKLILEHGKILEYNSSQAMLAEDETVNIIGEPYGDSAPYMIFDGWSGNPDDLQYTGDISLQQTTYTMQYHDNDSYEVTLTANFKIRIPRKLILHGGFINDDIGGSQRDFFAGDEVLIIADKASPEKRFYEWEGTEAGRENLTGGTEPSTSWLVMPDCDVELTSKYINAGVHSVKVDGVLQGWYDYNEYVSIYPESRGHKYSFSYWSGDTGYLDDVTSTSFKMPDVNVEFSSNWTYNYSYNNITMVNGQIDGETKLENVREDTSHTLTPYPAKDGYKFSHWSLEGLGSISGNTFTVGDGNAIITANYVKTHLVNIWNINHNNQVKSIYPGEGEKYSISTSQILDEWIFDYWDKDGERFSSSSKVNNIVMGTENVNYTAHYRPRNRYTLTVNNGYGSGTYREFQSVRIAANNPDAGYEFDRWTGDYTGTNADVNISMPSKNATITATYKVKETPIDPPKPPEKVYHNFTVENGSGSGKYYEGQSITCYGNQAPSSYEFSHWSEGDKIISYANPYKTTMGTKDRTIKANYKAIPFFNVYVINGSGSGTYARNFNPRIICDYAPEGMKFLQWEVVNGDDNDITNPRAENTTIRNLTHDVTVKAIYYVPDDTILYTLTIEHKDGSTEDFNNPIGTQVNIFADQANEGYEFARWSGDVQYVNDRYAKKAIVNMPPKNINLRMEYEEIGAIKKYYVLLHGGEILVETTEDGTERWDIQGDFQEGTKLTIRAVDIPPGYKFNGWKNDEDDGKSVSTVADLMEPVTTIRVEDFRIELTRDVILRNTYELTVENGETSGVYYDTEPVNVYFKMPESTSEKYKFIRWSGDDLAYINLALGGVFDIFRAEQQTISMPDRNIKIKAEYDTLYKLSIDSVEEGYYLPNEEIPISAEEIEGKRFLYWEGDIEYIDNPYNPNIIVTIPNKGVNIIPKYHNINDTNNIGYVLTDISKNDIINIEDIIIIAGEIGVGFMITDINGHIYIITNYTNIQCNIMRLTTIQGGDDDGQ